MGDNLATDVLRDLKHKCTFWKVATATVAVVAFIEGIVIIF